MLITFADQSLFVKVLLLNTCKDFTFLFDFFPHFWRNACSSRDQMFLKYPFGTAQLWCSVFLSLSLLSALGAALFCYCMGNPSF